jgi:hypothetical protein
VTVSSEATETPAFVLWFRPPGKRQRWRAVGEYPTEREATSAIRGAGDWYVAPAGRHPADNPPPRF